MALKKKFKKESYTDKQFARFKSCLTLALNTDKGTSNLGYGHLDNLFEDMSKESIEDLWLDIKKRTD